MEKPEIHIIDMAEQMEQLIDRLAEPTYMSALYMALEGVNLCRDGSISIITFLVDSSTSRERIYILDVHTLGTLTFDTAGTVTGKTLRGVLQDEEVKKILFDARNDSDALFAHYGVALQGVEDVQLMESAARKDAPSRMYLSGLARCIEKNMITWPDQCSLATWKKAKEQGERLFKAELGGSYEVFNQRPTPEAIVSYCIGDVLFLPMLHNRFKLALSIHQDTQPVVQFETRKRVAPTPTPDYQPYGRERALAPWSAEQNMILDKPGLVSSSHQYFGKSHSFNEFDIEERDDGDYFDDPFDDDYDDQDDNDFDD